MLKGGKTTRDAIFWFAAIAMSVFFVASIGDTMFLLQPSTGWSIGEAVPEEPNSQGTFLT